MQKSSHAKAPGYRTGDIVEIFYRMSKEEHYFPVDSLTMRCLRPRFGRTDGWMRAVVVEDWSPASSVSSVRVRHLHELWADRHGQALNPQRDRDMVVSVPLSDVRWPSEAPRHVTLSLLIVRWGGQETDFNIEQWGAASSSTSNAYVSAFVDETVYNRLGPDYEVWSVFVTSGADLALLQPMAIVPRMMGRHRAACYFLWPVTAQDGDHELESGMVEQASYFQAVCAVEAAGVCTRFPHPSQLYRQLLSKEWQPALCLLKQLRIPPATMVNRATVGAAPRRAAQLACAALDQIRAARYLKKAEPVALRVAETESRKGVAKLGFAWEAAHVRVFRGEDELATALLELCSEPGSTASHVIVQDFARNDFELRQFVVRGRVEHRVYSNFAWVDGDGYMREFVMKERADAVRDWLDGDDAAMGAAERKAARLVEAWMTWLRCQSVEALPAVRIDILVRRSAPGAVELFTLEVTELGFSMLAWPAGPPTVFGALLESCLADTGAEAEEAARVCGAVDADEGAAVAQMGGNGESVVGSEGAGPSGKRQRLHSGDVGNGPAARSTSEPGN